MSTAGAASSGVLSDWAGRRSALGIACAPFITGWLFIALGGAPAPLFTGRFLTGVGVGLVSNLVPNYIAEISPRQLRGTLGATNQAWQPHFMEPFIVGPHVGPLWQHIRHATVALFLSRAQYSSRCNNSGTI